MCRIGIYTAQIEWYEVITNEDNLTKTRFRKKRELYYLKV